MKKVKLELQKMTIPEKMQKTKTVITKMTGNTNFTTPIPSLTSVTAAINKLELSYEAALDGGKTKKAIVRVDEASLDTLMSQLGAYIQDITLGDELKILSSGLEVAKKPSPPQDLTTPINLRLNKISVEGEVNLKWNPIKNAKSYMIQSTSTPQVETSWDTFAVSTKASHKANNLESQSIIWFRIAALGAKGISAFSDPFKASIL
jgi:hypothetical protein